MIYQTLALLLTIAYVSAPDPSETDTSITSPTTNDESPPARPYALFLPISAGYVPDANKKKVGLMKEFLSGCAGDIGPVYHDNQKLIEPENNLDYTPDCQMGPNVVVANGAETSISNTFNYKVEGDSSICSKTAHEDGKAFGPKVKLIKFRTRYNTPQEPYDTADAAQKAGKQTTAFQQAVLWENIPLTIAVTAKDKELSICGDKRAARSGSGNDVSVQFANEFTSKIEKVGTIVPRWLEKDEERFNLGATRFKRDLKRKAKITEFEKTEPLRFHFNEATDFEGKKWIQCNTMCRRGKMIKFQMKPASYKFLIPVNIAKTPSFKICLLNTTITNHQKIEECNPQMMIEILVKNGVVVWPGHVRASLIPFVSRDGTSGSAIIEFGYGIKVGTQQAGEFYVANTRREIVTSDSAGFQEADSHTLAFFFPNFDSVEKAVGIFSPNVIFGYEAIADTETPVNLTKLIEFSDVGEAIVKPRTHEVIVEVKEEPAAIVATTTIAPPVIAMHLSSATVITSVSDHSALYEPGKWWTWALYFGFIIGTFLTLLIGGALCFVMRRTIYSIWYRGMFKRYGCDASGTTAGITGIGFGAETTGAITVGGTTGGGTTAGTTGTGTSTVSGVSSASNVSGVSGTNADTTGGGTLAL